MKIAKVKRQEWLEKGYEYVAENDFETLSVNSLARAVGKSKSSFYHHFGDIEIFITELLDYHLQQANQFAINLSQSKTVDPELINVFLDYKLDILFHKQIRINREKAPFKEYISKTFVLYEETLAGQLASYFGLGQYQILAQKLTRFVSEHFILSITAKVYSFEWFQNYLNEIVSMIRHIKMVK